MTPESFVHYVIENGELVGLFLTLVDEKSVIIVPLTMVKMEEIFPTLYGDPN